MNVFYTPDLASSSYTFDETESKHAIRVLRLNLGDMVYLIDGKGGFYHAQITNNNPKQCSVEVTETFYEHGKRNYRIHIGIAPTKNTERLEWFLEKTTEIGIDEITPIICVRSERRALKTERLVKVITAAVKQSAQAYHPIINKELPLDLFVARVSQQTDIERYIAHCYDTTKYYLKDIYTPATDAVILIGPEGDFTEDEVNFSVLQGFREITLGNTRLRTETAGIVACHSIAMLNN